MFKFLILKFEFFRASNFLFRILPGGFHNAWYFSLAR
jgi:hypothetical protein